MSGDELRVLSRQELEWVARAPARCANNGCAKATRYLLPAPLTLKQH